MTMAALLHVDPQGDAMVVELIRRSGLSAEEWIRRYLRAYLTPILHCFYAYDIIFINPSDTVYTISVSRITFEDRSMTQLAAYEPEEGIVTGAVVAGGAVQFPSEAQIDVPSILDANRIRNLVIWATFRMGTADD
mgnify:CR=1 FL=1